MAAVVGIGTSGHNDAQGSAIQIQELLFGTNSSFL